MIRLLRKPELFDAHVCRGGVPCTAAWAPLLRPIATNGNLGDTALSGAAIHQTIRRAAPRMSAPTLLPWRNWGGYSLRARFVTRGIRNGADGSAIVRQTGHTSLDSVEIY